jgi:hypothetical protein
MWLIKGAGYLKPAHGVLRGPRIGTAFQGTLYDHAGWTAALRQERVLRTKQLLRDVVEARMTYFRMCRNWVATKSRLSQLTQRHSISFTTRTALSFQPENA